MGVVPWCTCCDMVWWMEKWHLTKTVFSLSLSLLLFLSQYLLFSFFLSAQTIGWLTTLFLFAHDTFFFQYNSIDLLSILHFKLCFLQNQHSALYQESSFLKKRCHWFAYARRFTSTPAKEPRVTCCFFDQPGMFRLCLSRLWIKSLNFLLPFLLFCPKFVCLFSFGPVNGIVDLETMVKKRRVDRSDLNEPTRCGYSPLICIEFFILHSTNSFLFAT